MKSSLYSQCDIQSGLILSQQIITKNINYKCQIDVYKLMLKNDL